MRNKHIYFYMRLLISSVLFSIEFHLESVTLF